MTTHYKMNPRVDTLKYGHELEEGMIVLRERWYSRGEREDEFAEIIRLEEGENNYIRYFARYEDGFMESVCAPKTNVWIVKEGYHKLPDPGWEFKFTYKPRLGGHPSESCWCDVREQEIDWTDQIKDGCVIQKVSFRRAR